MPGLRASLFFFFFPLCKTEEDLEEENGSVYGMPSSGPGPTMCKTCWKDFLEFILQTFTSCVTYFLILFLSPT